MVLAHSSPHRCFLPLPTAVLTFPDSRTSQPALIALQNRFRRQTLLPLGSGLVPGRLDFPLLHPPAVGCRGRIGTGVSSAVNPGVPQKGSREAKLLAERSSSYSLPTVVSSTPKSVTEITACRCLPAPNAVTNAGATAPRFNRHYYHFPGLGAPLPLNSRPRREAGNPSRERGGRNSRERRWQGGCCKARRG